VVVMILFKVVTFLLIALPNEIHSFDINWVF